MIEKETFDEQNEMDLVMLKNQQDFQEFSVKRFSEQKTEEKVIEY